MESKEVQDLALMLIKAIPVLAGTAGVKNTRFITGTVKTVDEDNRICSVEGIMDSETVTYEEVNLSPERNDGFILMPAIDSTVIVAKMPDGESYVVNCSDIEKIICLVNGSNKYVFDSNGFVWNDGTFGGLIKIDDLTTQLNTRLNLIKTSILSALTAVDLSITGLGGAAGGVTAWNTAIAAYTNLSKAAYEDTKIKH